MHVDLIESQALVIHLNRVNMSEISDLIWLASISGALIIVIGVILFIIMKYIYKD
jgi:hypothetical protein